MIVGGRRGHISLKTLLFFAALVVLSSFDAEAALLQGCTFDETLCEGGEVCVSDGLFGQCYSDVESELVKPLILERPLTSGQEEVLELELARLATSGHNWPNAKSQCILAYFKLVMAYELDYDTQFCEVRDPQRVWELVQDIQTLLLKEEEETEGKLRELLTHHLDDQALATSGDNSAEMPVVVFADGSLSDSQAIDTSGRAEILEVANPELLTENDGPFLLKVVDIGPNQSEDKVGDESWLIQEGPNNNASREEIGLDPGTDEQQQQVLKKDAEKFTSMDMGLANIAHKIVKGNIQRVEGSRIYMKMAQRNLTEEELLKLIEYLDQQLGDPNSLFFDEFLYEDGQLSFRVSRVEPPQLLKDFGEEGKKGDSEPFDSPSEVASAVYKRRKDILTFAHVKVDETGIGSGDEIVPVEHSGHDALFVPILAICAFTIASLLSVLAVHIYRNRRNHSKSGNRSYLPEVIDQLEGKASAIYEELCRQRVKVAGKEVPLAVKIGGQVGQARSTRSSTSSWPDESSQSNLDISTGHVLLDFLQNQNPKEISDQWTSMAGYRNKLAQVCPAAEEQCNAERNFDPSLLPYEDTAVTLHGDNGHSYINASRIHDSDPLQAVYIATQNPLHSTQNDFWQMIWEQGIALLVNLANDADYKLHENLAKYWPEGSHKVFGGIFEVHLVSEHIWSEDYVIRSFYLKNLSTNETRTVTQFHYLSWPEGGVPSSIKSLLEFRRKVNKSYRGKASPILVHCTNGAGRTGTFCLLDMVMGRILKGVKELDIVASLEHLRDQRMGMVDNQEQFAFIFGCVAEEVNLLLANLKG